MLSLDERMNIPICPHCLKTMRCLEIRLTATKYYEFNKQTRQYDLAQREKIDDDNLFHCSECGAGIEMKEIFETLIHIP